MNANDFIKKYGIEHARSVVNGAPVGSEFYHGQNMEYVKDIDQEHKAIAESEINIGHLVNFRSSCKGSDCQDCQCIDGFMDNSAWIEYIHYLTPINNLKCLIASHEYVEIHGFEKSKEILANAPEGAECYSWSIGNSGIRDKTVHLDKLQKAIADVEACK